MSDFLDKARVVEVLRDLAIQRMDRPSLFQTGWVDALSEVATGLGLTLATPQSGPGGGNPKAVNREAFDKVYGEAARKWDAAFDRHEAKVRARIAPTPTPEVPPLTPSLSPAPESAPDSNSPQTPAVVWERKGLKVFADGSCKGFGLLDPVGVCKALARALAEAKREVAEMRKAHDAVQYAEKNEAWATAGGDVLAIHSKRLEKDTAETAKQAAESMRERAAKECDARAKYCQERADALPVGPVRGKWLIALGEAQLMAFEIRNLPLE